MSDLSHTSGSSAFTPKSDPTNQEEDVKASVVEDSKLRPRRSWNSFTKIEDVGSKYKDIIATLPRDELLALPGWPLRQYKCFWDWENFILGTLKMIEDFKPRPNDILIASFPKAGTTWLKALVFAIVHRDKYTFSDHPLLKLSPRDCVRQLEETYSLQEEQYLETLLVPRVLATHKAYSILPESVKGLNCRIIYICREPKDVVVSFWHMYCMIMKELMAEPRPFAQVFELFCTGKVWNGPIWDHVLEYYMLSLQDPNKILFLKYEEMMSNPIDAVTRISNFVGSPFSEEEVKKGVVEEIVQLCSFGKMKDLDVNKKTRADDAVNNIFFRKAIVGDWQNHMTAEMATKLDEIIRDKLKDSGFTF